MEQYPDEEVQRNSQNYILIPLVKLLAELTRGQSITLKNQILYHEESDSNGAPAARVVQETIRVTNDKIQYRSHIGVYEITNPYIARSSETEFKHSDISDVPIFLSDSTCEFTKEGMQLRQNLFNGHTSKNPITATFTPGSPENDLWIFGIVMKIISYLKEQIKLGLIDLDESSELINQFADSLIGLVYEKLGELENRSNEKTEVTIQPRHHFGEVIPSAGIQMHSSNFTLEDVTISFTNLTLLLRLSQEDESRFDALYAQAIRTLEEEELKQFLELLTHEFQEDFESVAISFPMDTKKGTPHLWGESFALNLDLNTKEWLLRTTIAPQGYIEEDGELVYPERVINNSFNGSANLNSILTLLGLLGYVSPMNSIKAFE